jgi:hypothetical protein
MLGTLQDFASSKPVLAGVGLGLGFAIGCAVGNFVADEYWTGVFERRLAVEPTGADPSTTWRDPGVPTPNYC